MRAFEARSEARRGTRNDGFSVGQENLNPNYKSRPIVIVGARFLGQH
jgi:hypothetical protein